MQAHKLGKRTWRFETDNLEAASMGVAVAGGAHEEADGGGKHDEHARQQQVGALG